MSKSATTATNGASAGSSYFEQKRALVLQDINENLEQVLQNLNRLNRNLEGVIAVGNEFSSVEALWSHFEGIMAKDPAQDNGKKTGADAEAHSSPTLAAHK